MRDTSRISRRGLKQSHSETSNGLTPPPPSHRKPQLLPLAASPAGIHEPSATATRCITTQDTDRSTALNRRISQPSSIYLITLSIWLHVRLLRTSSQTPGNTHYEEPTMTCFVSFSLFM